MRPVSRGSRLPSETEHLQPVVDALIDELLQAHRRQRASLDYGVYEQALGACFRNAERGVHAKELAALDVDAPEVWIRGKRHRRVGRYPATYKTLAGPVTVERILYRDVAVRNGKTVDIVSLKTGAVAGHWLPYTARSMAFMMAHVTSRECEAMCEHVGRLMYSRSSFERVGHAVGERYVAQHVDIEERLIEQLDIPDAAVAIAVSIDRVSLPMEESVTEVTTPEPQLHITAEEAGRVPRGRSEALERAIREAEAATPAKIERNYRMAYCATVSLADAQGAAVHTIRYGRMPKGNVRSLWRRLRDDVESLRRRRPDLKVVCVTDAAREFEGPLQHYLSSKRLGTEVTHLVDFWHASEYLAEAATQCQAQSSNKDAFNVWRSELMTPGGADRVLQSLKDTGLGRRTYLGKQSVKDAIRYFSNHRGRMRYAEARARNLPIGSGPVEATCKSLVSQRMKRSGSRWKHKTGTDVIMLRALVLSDRWHDAMDRVIRPKRARVLTAPM